MSIEIYSEKCIGCGGCAKVCPGNLISMQDNKAHIKYPQNCWGCASCVKECPVEAVNMYLGEDIGGLGARLTIKYEGPILHWKIKKANNSVHTITIDSRNSNKY